MLGAGSAARVISKVAAFLPHPPAPSPSHLIFPRFCGLKHCPIGSGQAEKMMDMKKLPDEFKRQALKLAAQS